MSTGNSVTWIARTRAADGIERAVRVRTVGNAPAAADIAEEIPDPFSSASSDAAELAIRSDAVPGGLRAPAGSLDFAPPVRPSKILAVGRNFRAHAAEMGNELPKEPLLFFKPPSCLAGSGEPVPLPRGFERIDMESELVLVVGRRGRNIPPERAWAHLAGVTLGNDISCRDLQRRDDQWTRAKGYDGFGPVGPWFRVTPGDEPLALADTRIVGRLNGEIRQDASLGNMIFDPAAIVACASAVMTLEPGDLIFMGTPEGVSPLQPGDVATVETSGALVLAPLTTRFT